MAPILEQAATELLGAVTVARVDVMNNRDIGTRFSIEGFPTLVLFSQGHMYTFKGRRTVEEVVEFARGGFQLHEPVAAPWETALFRELILVSRHAYKEATRDLLEGNLYTINVFCIALPIIFGLLLFIVFFIPFSKPDHRQPLEFPADDVRSDIPVSRRARQPTSSTDTYLRKSTKGD